MRGVTEIVGKPATRFEMGFADGKAGAGDPTSIDRAYRAGYHYAQDYADPSSAFADWKARMGKRYA